MKKNTFLIIVFLTVIKLALIAQNKLYFVKDSVLPYSESKKTRFFRTDTFDLTQVESSLKFDMLKISKSDSLYEFYIYFYVRNNTNFPVRLTRMTTNAGDNVPYWPNKPFEPNTLQCYEIMQGYLKEKSNRTGYLEWQYFDKKEQQWLTKTAVLAYKYELSD